MDELSFCIELCLAASESTLVVCSQSACFYAPFFKGNAANYFDRERVIGLFSFCQDVGSGTDFLKNAITYGPAEGFGDDLWQVDDVSLFFFAPSFILCSGGRQGDIKMTTQNCSSLILF